MEGVLTQSNPAVSARVRELDAPRGQLNGISENSGKNHFNFPREIMQELDSSQNDTEFQYDPAQDRRACRTGEERLELETRRLIEK